MTYQATVKFGKITSKDTWRDIMRFWRLMLVDLFPECPQIQELFEVYFEWVSLALLVAHSGPPCIDHRRSR